MPRDVPSPAGLCCVAPISDDLWRESIACRFRNLYEPFGLGMEYATSELDSPRDRPEVIHLIATLDGAVVGTGRLDLQSSHERVNSAQLRYCAVDATQRGRGVGQTLVRSFDELARARGVERIWMDAREDAVRFYERMGYRDVAPGPLKFGIIPHRVMEKEINEP